MLRTKWIQQERGDSPTDDAQRRRDLVRRLRGTDGYELLAVCATEISKVPFASITRFKNGVTISDQRMAKDLTEFLHLHAGLAFYYQLFYSSSDRFPPLLEYVFVQLVYHGEHELMAAIRSNLGGKTLKTCGSRSRG